MYGVSKNKVTHMKNLDFTLCSSSYFRAAFSCISIMLKTRRLTFAKLGISVKNHALTACKTARGFFSFASVLNSSLLLL